MSLFTDDCYNYCQVVWHDSKTPNVQSRALKQMSSSLVLCCCKHRQICTYQKYDIVLRQKINFTSETHLSSQQHLYHGENIWNYLFLADSVALILVLWTNVNLILTVLIFFAIIAIFRRFCLSCACNFLALKGSKDCIYSHLSKRIISPDLDSKFEGEESFHVHCR